MAKISYSKLGIKNNSEVNTFEFNGQKIEVLKYLPIEDKYDLISIVLQRSLANDIYNELLTDTYFHLFLVYLYTNITFTEKQKENEMKLYNNLQTSGFMTKFLETIEESEYNYLLNTLETEKLNQSRYSTSAASILQKFVIELPKSMEQASELIDKFDPDQYERMVNLAQTLGYKK